MSSSDLDDQLLNPTYSSGLDEKPEIFPKERYDLY